MKLLNLASNNSFWRGIDYHHEKRVKVWVKTGDEQYRGVVRGSGDALYHVEIDIAHPRKSKCDCPFAEGRRVICKHMIALNLAIFPEKEAQMMEYIEEQNRIYEEECEAELENQKSEIVKYVMSLSKAELREELINRMIDELEEEQYW